MADKEVKVGDEVPVASEVQPQVQDESTLGAREDPGPPRPEDEVKE